MSSLEDEFEPPAAVVDALLADLVRPQLRSFERELRSPIVVEGHTAVRGQETTRWHIASTRKSGVLLALEGRATFRRTGGTHILFRVQVLAPPSPETTWTGLVLDGRIRADRAPISVEPQGKIVLHNQTGWLSW